MFELERFGDLLGYMRRVNMVEYGWVYGIFVLPCRFCMIHENRFYKWSR
jgi:hypothetical protein